MTTTVEAPTKSAEKATALAWLAANSIDEVLPDEPIFIVSDDTIIYRAWQFKNNERGHDTSKLRDKFIGLMVEDRVVPLVEPVSADVRAAFAVLENADKANRAVLLEYENRSTLKRDLPDWAQRKLGPVTDRTYKVQLFRRPEGRPVEVFTVAADRGELKLSCGPHDRTSDPEPSIVLTLQEVDNLIRALPQLRAWMVTGRPARAPYDA